MQLRQAAGRPLPVAATTSSTCGRLFGSRRSSGRPLKLVVKAAAGGDSNDSRPQGHGQAARRQPAVSLAMGWLEGRFASSAINVCVACVHVKPSISSRGRATASRLCPCTHSCLCCCPACNLQGKTQAAAAAAPVESVDDLMLKLAALGSAALGANAESAAAALAGSAAASAREKQPRRMKLLRQQVAALQEKQQQLEEEMSLKEQVRGTRVCCYLLFAPADLGAALLWQAQWTKQRGTQGIPACSLQ